MYPPHLHELHSQWPLAPEKYEVTYDELSNFSKLQLAFSNDPSFEKQIFSETKLIPHFRTRKNYICHIKNLIFYLKNGLALNELHSAVSFRQKAWLKDYIMYVANLRSNAKENGQDFFVMVMKALANDTFGKFCENPENYRKIEMARAGEQLKHLASSPNFIKQHILSQNLVLCEMVPEKCSFKFQYAVASTILDFSKLFMYEFWYDTLLPHFYPDVPNLLMTDTDSAFFPLNVKILSHINKYNIKPFQKWILVILKTKSYSSNC